MSTERGTRGGRKKTGKGREEDQEVSDVRPKVIAVLASDIHLRDRTPVARAEQDWNVVQFGYIRQLKDLAIQNQCLTIIAGDIFDKWKVSPELINRAIREFRDFPSKPYVIPGQHDLPHHNYQEMSKSSYGTLAEAGVVVDMQMSCSRYTLPVVKTCQEKLWLHVYPFPWGKPVAPLKRKPNDKSIHLAVVHDYCFMSPENAYPGAPEDKNIRNVEKNLSGYDVVHYGDNHKFFLRLGRPRVFNPGSFIRQKADEKDHNPKVGLLLSDGSIDLHLLNTKTDKWADREAVSNTKEELDAGAFLTELQELGEHAVHFGDFMKRYFDKNTVTPEVRRVILDAMEGP